MLTLKKTRVKRKQRIQKLLVSLAAQLDHCVLHLWLDFSPLRLTHVFFCFKKNIFKALLDYEFHEIIKVLLVLFVCMITGLKVTAKLYERLISCFIVSSDVLFCW